MPRGALIVGNNYSGNIQLNGCVNDACAIAEQLRTNGDGSANFNVRLIVNEFDRDTLLQMIWRLFEADLDAAVFYFAGHGTLSANDGELVTPDFNDVSKGISMKELLAIVNSSKIRDKLIIADCCHAGTLGQCNPATNTHVQLSEGTTIITAARRYEAAIEKNGHGLFTGLFVEALMGGAAEITGAISSAGVYRYIDSILNFWEQRPQFRTNVKYFLPLRNMPPAIPFPVLRKIHDYFPAADYHFPLTPYYEYTEKDADDACIAIFKDLQKMQSVGLVAPVGEEFMYYAAIHSKACKLTPLGQQYWKLVEQGKI